MTPKEAMAVLLSAFRQDRLTDEGVALYVNRLRDIQPPLLRATVQHIVDTRKTTFLPAIGEIRETAARLAGILPPGPEEALGIVRRADVEEPVYDRGGQLAHIERYWEWPEGTPQATVEFIRRALAKVGDPVTRDGKRVFGFEQDFKAAYEGVAEEATRTALADLSRAALPAPISKALPAPTPELPEADAQANLERVRGIVGTLATQKALPS